MHEHDVAVLLSMTTCCHEIAFPEGGSDTSVGIDYASVNMRGGNPEGIREATPHAVCSCIDGIAVENLMQAWIYVETERLLQSARCFKQLLLNLEERGILQDVSEFVDIELLNAFDAFKKGTAKSPDTAAPKDDVCEDDRGCVSGLTDC